MSCSEKQLAANRLNAQKSTGPRTDEGKAASSRNAIRHGLYSSDLIIKSPYLQEDAAEFDSLVAGLTEDLQPQGALQQQLVMKIAACLWRQRRILNAETASINREISHRSLFPAHRFEDLRVEDVQVTQDLMDRIHCETVPYGEFAKTLIRYEFRLDRQLMNALNALRALQANTKCGKRSHSSQPTPANTPPPEQPPRGDTSIFDDIEKWPNEPISPQSNAAPSHTTGSAPTINGRPPDPVLDGQHINLESVIPAKAASQCTPPFVVGSEPARDEDDDDNPEFRRILHFGG